MQFCSCWILRYPRNMDIFKYYLLPRILAHTTLTSSKFGIFELGVAEDEILEPAPRAGHTALPSQTRGTCCWGEGGEEGDLIWSWSKKWTKFAEKWPFFEEKATVLSRRPPSRSSVEKKDEGLVAKRETELSLLPTPFDGVIHLVAEST